MIGDISNCSVKTGFNCTQTPSYACETHCGDNFMRGIETCDTDDT